MINQANKNIVTISEKTIRREKGVVILPLKEYQKLCERTMPTYYLKGRAAEKLDKLVGEGLRKYEKGKCKEIKSLAELD